MARPRRSVRLQSAMLPALLLLPLAVGAPADAFLAWKAKYNKVYASADAEEQARRAFLTADEYIRSHASMTWKLAHNEFSDTRPANRVFGLRTSSIKRNATSVAGAQVPDSPLPLAPPVASSVAKAMHSPRRHSERHRSRARTRAPVYPSAAHPLPPLTQEATVEARSDLPAAIDWVAKGAVGAVQNQGQCGSCWAFSAAGAIEAALFIARGVLHTLSAEELVQCDTQSQGCVGGSQVSAFEFVRDHGIVAESAYPYTSGGGTTGECDAAREGVEIVAKLDGYRTVTGTDNIMAAVAQQPVAVGMFAQWDGFQHYSSGVISASQASACFGQVRAQLAACRPPEAWSLLFRLFRSCAQPAPPAARRP